MAFDYDPEERQAFRETIAATVRQAFPDAALAWVEYDRRLIVTWPDIGSGSIFEPNFFFSRGYWSDAQLLDQIVRHLRGQRLDLALKA